MSDTDSTVDTIPASYFDHIMNLRDAVVAAKWFCPLGASQNSINKIAKDILRRKEAGNGRQQGGDGRS